MEAVALCTEMARSSPIGAKIVCNEHFHVIAMFSRMYFRHRAGSDIGHMEHPQFTVALANANDGLLVRRAASALAMRPSADIGFVHFNRRRSTAL